MAEGAPLAGGTVGPTIPTLKQVTDLSSATGVGRGDRQFETSRNLARIALSVDHQDDQAIGPRSSIANDAVLANALVDMRVLISFLSRSRGSAPGEEQMLIPAECLRVVHNIESNRSFSADDESFLWAFLAELHAAVHPATPDTIRNSSIADDIGVEVINTRDRSAKFLFWLAAAVIFLSTLTVGAYLALADRVIAENQAKATEFFSIVALKYENTRLEHTTPPGIDPTIDTDQATGVPDRNATQQSPPPDDNPDPEYSPSSKVYEDPEAVREIALKQISEEIFANNKALLALSWPADIVLGQHDTPASDEQNSMFDRSAVSKQQSINALLSAFLFPALAAVLGAIVFIIRDSHFRRENIQLSTWRYSYYGPRIILSAISGIIVGWLSGEKGDFLGQLSPIVAAFMIGYSTDVLFNILDTLKASIGGRNVTLK